jgi:Ferritin-like
MELRLPNSSLVPRVAQRVCSQKSNWRGSVLDGSHVCLRQESSSSLLGLTRPSHSARLASQKHHISSSCWSQDRRLNHSEHLCSLKRDGSEGVTVAQLEAITRWERQVSLVATQEMLHLTLVNNLLSSIGSIPYFSRPNFPQHARYYPAGVQLALLPFGRDALQHFLTQPGHRYRANRPPCACAHAFIL